MRFRLAIAVCLGFALIATTGFAQSQDESSSRLLVLNRDAARSDGGVRILRGTPRSAAAATAPSQDEILGPGRWQAVAGERFWLVDQETGKLTSCRNRGTANVGEREIECTFGTFGRYRRTFGNNFRH